MMRSEDLWPPYVDVLGPGRFPLGPDERLELRLVSILMAQVHIEQSQCCVPRVEAEADTGLFVVLASISVNLTESARLAP
jgi:hypothetical protein